MNFIVLESRTLPAGQAIGETTVRPEQPPGRPGGIEPSALGQTPWSVANPSSVRCCVRGPGRALRIKQFLYDWAPPAAGIAPLWSSPGLVPVPLGAAVAWLGTDYRGARGACIELERTQCEVSVTKGEYCDDELVALLDGLVPADPSGAEEVRRTPFHTLNYWLRYRVAPYRVPYGLWRVPHERPYDRARTADRETLRRLGFTTLLPPDDSDFAFESAAVVDDGNEAEIRLRRRGSPGDPIWIVTWRADSPRAPQLPPEPESRPCEVREERRLRGSRGWIAALTRVQGAWEAWWREGGCTHALWAQPAAIWTEAAFTDLVESLRPA